MFIMRYHKRYCCRIRCAICSCNSEEHAAFGGQRESGAEASVQQAINGIVARTLFCDMLVF